MLIDTHCHLDASEFAGAQAELIIAAHNAGIKRMVVPAVSVSNFETVYQLSEKFPSCFPAYGIHPMYVDEAAPDDLTKLKVFLEQHRPVAVGEIGLDFFVQHFDRARQEYFFIEQLKLARDFDLPVLLHVRRAVDVVLKNLREHPVRGGIAHAFNGSRQQADELIKLGFKLGFGGAMTYERATKLRELAATLPLDAIVLETDAPDIPPDFLERGLPNEPQYLVHTAEVLAKLRGVSVDVVSQQTTQNAQDVLPNLVM